jgi:hypothetical protein
MISLLTCTAAGFAFSESGCRAECQAEPTCNKKQNDPPDKPVVLKVVISALSLLTVTKKQNDPPDKPAELKVVTSAQLSQLLGIKLVSRDQIC